VGFPAEAEDLLPEVADLVTGLGAGWLVTVGVLDEGGLLMGVLAGVAEMVLSPALASGLVAGLAETDLDAGGFATTFEVG
jgi:hypothetical protein